MDNKKADLIYFAMVIFVLVALPFGISSYDQNIWNDKKKNFNPDDCAK